MYKPNFDMGIFKKTLVKESLKRKFSLDELDKIVELISQNTYYELRHPSNGITFKETNSPKKLSLCFEPSAGLKFDNSMLTPPYLLSFFYFN